jgi:transposase
MVAPSSLSSPRKIERLLARLQNYRRLVTRYEYYLENFTGMLHLACALILLGHL